MNAVEGVSRDQGELIRVPRFHLPVLGVLERLLVHRQRLSCVDEYVLVLVELDPAALDEPRRLRERRGEGRRREGFLVVDLFVEHQLTLVGRGQVYPYRAFLEHRNGNVLYRWPPGLEHQGGGIE